MTKKSQGDPKNKNYIFIIYDMADIKNVIDENQDYTLIKSGAGRTLVLVKKNGVIKGKVLCKNFMNLDIEKMENLTLIEQDKLNDIECPENVILQKIIETTQTEPTTGEVKLYKTKIPQNLLNSITHNVKKQDDRNELFKAIITLVNSKNLKKIEQNTPDEVKKYVTNFSNLLQDIKQGQNNLNKITSQKQSNNNNIQLQPETKGYNTNMLDKVRELGIVDKNPEKDEDDEEWKGGKIHSHKKTYNKRDKLGRFIKRKTRKSSGGWLY